MERPEQGKYPQIPTATGKLNSEFICAKHWAALPRVPTHTTAQTTTFTILILLILTCAEPQQFIKQNNSQSSGVWVVFWGMYLEAPPRSSRGSRHWGRLRIGLGEQG